MSLASLMSFKSCILCLNKDLKSQLHKALHDLGLQLHPSWRFQLLSLFQASWISSIFSKVSLSFLLWAWHAVPFAWNSHSGDFPVLLPGNSLTHLCWGLEEEGLVLGIGSLCLTDFPSSSLDLNPHEGRALLLCFWNLTQTSPGTWHMADN